MKLYTYFRSSAAFRVRIALNLKDIQYHSVPVNLKPGNSEQFNDDYRALNPEARIPFLVDNDVHLSQSTAILEYLEEQYPNPHLLPGTVKGRATVRQMVNLIACDIHPLNNLSVLEKLKQNFSASQEACDAWYRDWIERGFAALEQLLAQHAGQYCVGDEISMADLYLVPQVWNAHRFSVNMGPFPIISRIYRHCLTLPAVEAALPERQDDNPNR